MNNKTKLIIDYLTIFLISLLVLVFTNSLIIRCTILNKNFVKNNIDYNYYEKVNTEIKRNMKNNMLSIHIDSKVLDNVYTKKDIKNSINNSLEILYDDYKKKIDSKNVEKKLRENINNYFKENNITEVNQTGLDEFVDIIMDTYESEFNISNNINDIGKIINRLTNIFNVVLLLSGITLILLIVYFRKNIIKYFMTPLFTTSLLNMFFVGYINSRIIIKYIMVVSNSFSIIIRNILSNIISTIIIVSVLYLFIAFSTLIIKNILDYKNSKNKKTTRKRNTTTKKTNTKKKETKKTTTKKPTTKKTETKKVATKKSTSSKTAKTKKVNAKKTTTKKKNNTKKTNKSKSSK